MRRRTSGGLPAEVTSFVGRRAELAEVRRALGEVRLLTLTGTGGVGKTRLAMRAAAGMSRAFPDGIWLAELGEVQAADAVTDEVASVFGLDNDTHQPLANLISFIADKRLLLVLDNCEHLLDACAALAEQLLFAADRLRILTTSRQRLDIPSERTLVVSSLAVPSDTAALTPDMLDQYDGVTLFIERAKAILPDFTVTDDTCDLVVDLCRRLEGIPLAIELTAARLRGFTLPQILDRLTDRYSLLTGGNRAAPRRQRTLQALIDWSYQLCTPAERTLWARLSVFAGGFDLPAAEAVAGEGLAEPGGDTVYVADVLADLVEKAIVGRTETHGHTRFWLLETIRQYGHDRLTEAGEQDLLRRRHRDWFQRWLERADAEWAGPNQDTWFRQVHIEVPNLRLALDIVLADGDQRQAALDFATTMCVHRRACGSLSEGRRLLDRALARSPAQTRARAKALWTAAWLALLQGDSPAARTLLSQSRAIAEHLDDPATMAHVVQFSALADLFDGDAAGAVRGFADAAERHRAVGQQSGAQLSLLQQVMARCFAGDPEAADAIKRTWAILRTTRGRVVAGWVHWYEAIDRFVRRDFRAAAKPAAQALRIGADLGELWLISLTLETLAWIAAAAGEHVRAARVLGAAETARRRIGSRLAGLGHLREHHADCVRTIRSAVGDEQFEAAYQAGCELSEFEAVSYATLRGSPGTGGGGRADESPLTAREREIAELVARGLSNQEIADTLVIARRTAETHVGNILTKLGFTTRAQIAAWAAEHRSLHRATRW